MGFLSSLNAINSVVGPALRLGTQAVAANQASQAEVNNSQRNAIIQNLIFQRQQRQAEIENALKQAQTGQATAETAVKQHQNRSPVFGEAGYTAAKGDEASAVANAQLPAHLEEMVEKGLIDRQTALAVQAAAHSNRTAELGTEYGYKGGLQQQQQGAEGTLLTQRLQGDLANRIAGIKQTQSGEIVPNLLHGWKNPLTPALPAQPAAPAAPAQSGIYDDLPNAR